MRDDNPVRSDLVALALPACAHCHGTGMRTADVTCKCVDRAVFRIVLTKVHEIAFGAHHARPIPLDGMGRGPKNRNKSSGRKHEDFSADVYLSAKRALTDPIEWAIFRFYHLQGATWNLIAPRLGIDKGTFFHAVYRIERNLGKMFRELEPYPLFPLDQYFQVTTRVVDVRPLPVPAPKPNGIPLCPPLAKHQPAPPEPEPAPAPEPEPEPAPIIWDEATMLKQTRAWWSDGVSSRAIASRWIQMGVTCPLGDKWTTGNVRAWLIRAPRAA